MLGWTGAGHGDPEWDDRAQVEEGKHPRMGGLRQGVEAWVG